MGEVVVTSESEGETETLAGRVAAGLQVGDVVGVAGELGAGKTTFVRGACRALGVTSPVASPTFTIGHRYAGRIPVAHLDLYRLDGMGEEGWADLEPYFDGTIAFVEWPERAGGWLPPVRATVTLSHIDKVGHVDKQGHVDKLGHVDENRRSIRIESDDDLQL